MVQLEDMVRDESGHMEETEPSCEIGRCKHEPISQQPSLRLIHAHEIPRELGRFGMRHL
jgi:hypothetical protein